MTSTPAAPDRLRAYVETWHTALRSVTSLLRDLDEEEWSRPTDLPGWDVRAVAAHLAHLEAELAGATAETETAEGLHQATVVSGPYTQGGVEARASLSNDAILDELAKAAAGRLEQLRLDPPTDPDEIPARTPGGIRWSWETLLRNRPVDLWMHEQDIRRAVGWPGGFDSPAAAHTVMVFATTFPFVVGKRVSPRPGTTVVLDVTGAHPVHQPVRVGSDGRAVPLDSDPSDPTVSLRMGVETFVVLCGGRKPPGAVPVEVIGDRELAHRVLSAMAVTP
jgi:uncharacterized protein (TIGR03083 family)